MHLWTNQRYQPLSKKNGSNFKFAIQSEISLKALNTEYTYVDWILIDFLAKVTAYWACLLDILNENTKSKKSDYSEKKLNCHDKALSHDS